MSEHEIAEHERDLAWQLFEVRRDHPDIAQHAHKALAIEPGFTGLRILLAMHAEALGNVDEARQILLTLAGEYDRQSLNALRALRDLDQRRGDYANAAQAATFVLRQSPEPQWDDVMKLGQAVTFANSHDEGWRIVADAVEMAAALSPDDHERAVVLQASHLFDSAAPTAVILSAVEASVRIFPALIELSVMLGFAYLANDRPIEAVPLFERVLREDPTEGAAQLGLSLALTFAQPLEQGLVTIDEYRAAGMGELAWQAYRDNRYYGSFDEAFAVLDHVLPAELAAVLAPGVEVVDETFAEQQLVAWHNGQAAGTGALWGDDHSIRLMSVADIDAFVEHAEANPEAYPLWADDGPPYFSVIGTDDAGNYAIVAAGGRLVWRTPTEDTVIAPSLLSWLWQRAAHFAQAQQ